MYVGFVKDKKGIGERERESGVGANMLGKIVLK